MVYVAYQKHLNFATKTKGTLHRDTTDWDHHAIPSRWIQTALTGGMPFAPRHSVLVSGLAVASLYFAHRAYARREATKGVHEQYEKVAAEYDQRWETYVRATISAFMRHAKGPISRLRSGARVLDVGTGTGAVPKAITSDFPTLKVSGADLSQGMIDTARCECAASDFVVAPAENMPFPASYFDLVTSLSSLHFWTSPASGLKEIHRVLQPGGQLVLSDWCHDFTVCQFCGWYLWLTPGHSKADWAILKVRDVRRMLAAAGFVDVSCVTYKVDAHVFGRWWLPRWGMMAFVAHKLDK